MAGAKGKSGGVRKGAGRKPKRDAIVPELPAAGNQMPPANEAPKTPLDFLLSVQNDISADPRLRVRAAIGAAQYMHTKRGDGGKKEEAADKAKVAGGGRFARKAPPKLVVNNGR